MKQTNSDSSNFVSSKVGWPADIAFRPFNRVSNQYYSVYFDVFSTNTWKTQQSVYEKEKKLVQQIEQQTVDALRMGEMQPERDHELTGESRTGENHGKKWRATKQDGSISFTLKTDPEKENELLLTYWGMDNRGKIFDILADGQPIATEDLNKYKGSRFYDITYLLPVSVTKGKEKITITIKSKPGNSVGPVYGTVRMIKKM